jgi:hypothetical protein
MDAYGWSDINLDHGFHQYRQMVRWTVSPPARIEILDRLLLENRRRAMAERANQVKTPADKIPTEEGTLFNTRDHQA